MIAVLCRCVVRCSDVCVVLCACERGATVFHVLNVLEDGGKSNAQGNTTRTVS